MSDRRLRIRLAGVIAAGLALGVAGCDTLDSMFEDREVRLPGERVSVLEFESRLQADPDLAATPVVLPQAVANTDWTQPGGDADNALYHLAAPGGFQQIWSVQAGAASSRTARITSGPVLANGTIYFIDGEATVQAIDAATGARRWEVSLVPEDRDAEQGFGGGVAFDAGRLFVTSGFGFTVALDPANGAEIWRHTVPVPVRTPPAAVDGKVYVVSQTNHLYVLAQSDGSEQWDYEAVSETAGVLSSTTPAVAGEVAVAGFTSGELFAFRSANGRVFWDDTLTRTRVLTPIAALNDIAGSPVIDRGFVFAISHSGRLAAIDLRTGQRVWETEVAGTQTPWPVGDQLYVVSLDARLICFNRTDGRVRWVTQLARYGDAEDREDPIHWSGPVLVSGRLAVVSSTGIGQLVSPETGEVLGQFAVPEGVFQAPIVANETMFVLSDEAELVALR